MLKVRSQVVSPNGEPCLVSSLQELQVVGRTIRQGEQMIRTLVCQRCVHRWKSATGDPDRCPRCKRADWQLVERFIDYECGKCGYEWNSKRSPISCALCKKTGIRAKVVMSPKARTKINKQKAKAEGKNK
jgi:predicted Zn-ribbon and HTH transcriptional regulator